MLEQEIMAKYGLSNDDARAAAASAMRLLESYIGKAYGAVDDTNSDEYKAMVEQDNKHWDKTFNDFLSYAKEHPTHKPVYMDMLKFSDGLYSQLKDALGDEVDAAVEEGKISPDDAELAKRDYIVWYKDKDGKKGYAIVNASEPDGIVKHLRNAHPDLEFFDDVKEYNDDFDDSLEIEEENESRKPGQDKEEKSIEAAEPKNAISSNVLDALKDRRM